MRRTTVGLGVLLLAFFARVWWIPMSRHRFDGHEADYLAVFQGGDWTGTTRLYPALAGFYAGLGALFSDPGVLLGVNVLAGLGTVFCGAFVVRQRYGDLAGLAAGLLLALSPEHAAWSTSAYNVSIPHFLVVAGCALGVLEGRWRWAGIPLYALACAMRVELALLAPVVAVLGGWRTAIGALGALGAWPVLDTSPALRDLRTVLPVNLQLIAFLGPCVVPAALAASRRTLDLLGAALLVHIVSACFDDYGARHALLGTVALIAVVAGVPGRRFFVVVPLALLLSAVSLHGLSKRYYATAEDFRATLDAPRVEGCPEVLDDPLDERSHWNRPWPDGACWGEEHHHYAWTSRGLQDRALRMHTAYQLEPYGILELGGGPRMLWTIR